MKKVWKLLLSMIFKKSDKWSPYRLRIIEIVNKIKAAVESDAATLVVAIIPGHTDDKILEFIRHWLPEILKEAGLSNQTFSVSMSVQDSIKQLKEVPDPERTGYYKYISGTLYAKATGLPFEQANDQIQGEYLKKSA